MFSFSFKKSVLIASSLLISLSLSNAFARPITLYDAPKAGAKSVGTIDSSKPLVPIFTSKDGDWMKVGNPDNGNVGWVKASELSASSGSGFSFTQQTVDTSSGPKTTIQFGVPQPMTPDQIKEMQKRQMLLQQSIQKMTEDMQNAYSNLPPGVPVFMPVIMVPSISVTPLKPPTAKSIAPVPPVKVVAPVPPVKVIAPAAPPAVKTAPVAKQQDSGQN
jgi:hypothetical protein